MTIKTLIPIGAQQLIPKALSKTAHSFIATIRRNGKIQTGKRVHMPEATLDDYPHVRAVPLEPKPYVAEDGTRNPPTVTLPTTLWELHFGASPRKEQFGVKVGSFGGIEHCELLYDLRKPPVEIISR